MSWEHFEKNYPTGMTTNFGFVTADQLRNNPEIEVVTTICEKVVRNMIHHEDLLIYGKNNELAVSVIYDLDNAISHPKEVHPLNIFATAMVRDFMDYNYISNN